MGSSFSVYFDGACWVGVVEVRETDGSVRAARHVFGAEPGAAELWAFVCAQGGELIDRAMRSPAVPTTAQPVHRPNPKRAARLAAREAARPAPSTAAQAALSAARDALGGEKRAQRKASTAAAAQRRRAAATAKRKARHRGH